MADIKLDPEELNLLFEQIRSGKKCVYVNRRILFFLYPNKELLERCTILEQAQRAIFGKHIPTIEKLPSVIDPTLSAKINQNIDKGDLDRDIVKLNRILGDEKIKQNEQSMEYYSKQLKDAEYKLRNINQVNGLKQRFDLFCLDSRIREIVFSYLINNSVFTFSENHYYPFFDGLQIREQLKWFRKLFPLFMLFYYGPQEATMRQLARSGTISALWKISCDTGSSLFSGPVSEYNNIQIKLCFWCGYYQNVFKNFGMPENHSVIDDDAAFDKWVQKKIDEMKDRSTNSNKGGDGTKKHVIKFKNPVLATSGGG